MKESIPAYIQKSIFRELFGKSRKRPISMPNKNNEAVWKKRPRSHPQVKLAICPVYKFIFAVSTKEFPAKTLNASRKYWLEILPWTFVMSSA